MAVESTILNLIVRVCQSLYHLETSYTICRATLNFPSYWNNAEIIFKTILWINLSSCLLNSLIYFFGPLKAKYIQTYKLLDYTVYGLSVKSLIGALHLEFLRLVYSLLSNQPNFNKLCILFVRQNYTHPRIETTPKIHKWALNKAKMLSLEMYIFTHRSFKWERHTNIHTSRLYRCTDL